MRSALDMTKLDQTCDQTCDQTWTKLGQALRISGFVGDAHESFQTQDLELVVDCHHKEGYK